MDQYGHPAQHFWPICAGSTAAGTIAARLRWHHSAPSGKRQIEPLRQKTTMLRCIGPSGILAPLSFCMHNSETKKV